MASGSVVSRSSMTSWRRGNFLAKLRHCDPTPPPTSTITASFGSTSQLNPGSKKRLQPIAMFGFVPMTHLVGCYSCRLYSGHHPCCSQIACFYTHSPAGQAIRKMICLSAARGSRVTWRDFLNVLPPDRAYSLSARRLLSWTHPTLRVNSVVKSAANIIVQETYSCSYSATIPDVLSCFDIGL